MAKIHNFSIAGYYSSLIFDNVANSKPRTNAIILITVSSEHPFNESDRQVAELIIRLCSGQTALLIKNDDSLGEELQLDVAFYEMKNSYLCPTFIQAL